MTVKDTILTVGGFKVSGVDAGLRKQPAPDVTLIVADGKCSAAGVFTTNQVRAAPVLLDKQQIEDHPNRIRAILINASCANACTGEEGMSNARQTTIWAADVIGCQPDEVLVMSTGVIGVQLPMDKMHAGVTKAAAALRADAWADAGRAIMTTDTRPKLASAEFGNATIAGIAKGAGMMAPNMATLLSVVVTDVEVSPELLHKALYKATAQSFNRITVDGDMSTNDTLLVLASGASGVTVTEDNYNEFTTALSSVCINLAKKIVKDGEGATKFIELHVTGAYEDWEARQIADSIANSPLVKTAFYGGDANWGRIMMAAGKSEGNIDPDRLSLWYDDLQLVAKGTPLNYDDAQANAIAAKPEIKVTLDLGQGDAEAIVWTCDLSHDYVSINGHYRT